MYRCITITSSLMFQISVVAVITDFTAEVVVTEHGEAYIQYNLTESWGVVFGRYTVSNTVQLDRELGCCVREVHGKLTR